MTSPAVSAEPAALPRRARDRRWPPTLPLAIVVALVLCGVLAPLLAPHSPVEGSLGERLVPPLGMEGSKVGHPLGTDRLGRDTLSRLLHGARISLAVSVVGISLTGAVGSFIGLLAGFLGGWVDTLLMRLGDISLSLPGILIAVLLSVVFECILLDEAVSALDVSIRAQIMNLLREIQDRLGVSYLFIAHDLAVVKYVSTRIGVMYLGKLVETAASDELYAHPLHPYTQVLLSNALPAHPDDTRDEVILKGEVPSAFNPPAGCRFHPRCPMPCPSAPRWSRRSWSSPRDTWRPAICTEREPTGTEPAGVHRRS